MKHKKGAYLDNADNCLFKDSESLAGFIGYMRIDIFIPHSRSLKERRQVLESLRKRIRNNFNVSLAQKPTEGWKSCELFFACAHYTKDYASNLMDRIQDFIREEPDIHLSKIEKGVL